MMIGGRKEIRQGTLGGPKHELGHWVNTAQDLSSIYKLTEDIYDCLRAGNINNGWSFTIKENPMIPIAIRIAGNSIPGFVVERIIVGGGIGEPELVSFTEHPTGVEVHIGVSPNAGYFPDLRRRLDPVVTLGWNPVDYNSEILFALEFS